MKLSHFCGIPKRSQGGLQYTEIQAGMGKMVKAYLYHKLYKNLEYINNPANNLALIFHTILYNRQCKRKMIVGNTEDYAKSHSFSRQTD